MLISQNVKCGIKINTSGIILYPELSFLLRYTPSLSTSILQDFWVPVMPTCYPNTGLILQKIFGRKLVSRESIGKLMMGRIQDSKLGGALKKIAPSGGRRENFGGISCENSRFYAKKADYRISLLPLTSNSKNKTVVSKLHSMSNL